MSFIASNYHNTEHNISKAIINTACLQQELPQSTRNAWKHTSWDSQQSLCCPSWCSPITSERYLFKQSLFTNTHQSHLCPSSAGKKLTNKNLRCAGNYPKHFVSLPSLALRSTLRAGVTVRPISEPQKLWQEEVKYLAQNCISLSLQLSLELIFLTRYLEDYEYTGTSR